LCKASFVRLFVDSVSSTEIYAATNENGEMSLKVKSKEKWKKAFDCFAETNTKFNGDSVSRHRGSNWVIK